MREQWDDFMVAAIQQFKLALTTEDQKRLDYSAASLDFVEQWLRDRYLDIELVDKVNQSIFLGAAFYVGETYRRHLNWCWKVDMSHFDSNDPLSYDAAQVLPDCDKPDVSGDLSNIIMPVEDVIEAIHARPPFLFFRTTLEATLKGPQA